MNGTTSRMTKTNEKSKANDKKNDQRKR